MITLQSRAYNKNKCNLISRSDGGADLLTWCLNIRVDYSFSIFRCLIRHFTVMHARRRADKTVQDVRATETLRRLY